MSESEWAGESVVSLHTELRSVWRVHECTRTWNTGVYAKYEECTRSMGLYKLIHGVQAFYYVIKQSP